jgi:hypothetical protein
MAINDSHDKVTLEYLEGIAQKTVELILLLCLRGATFYQLMQVMPLSSPQLLKKYLFYFIDYDLISYSGQSRIYTIKDVGLEILSRTIKMII